MSGPAVRAWWVRTSGDVRERARALLVAAAARTLAVPAGRIGVDHDGAGRPVLAGAGAGLHVAVSHCRVGVVAVALSPVAPVGVDVEVLRPFDWRPVAGRFMTEGEVAWLDGLAEPDRLPAFLHLWTAKEAVGKAYGTGLRGGGLRRAVLAGGGHPGGTASGGCWRLLPTPGDGAMAAAVGRPAPDVVLAVACHGGAAGEAVATVGEDDGG